MPKLYLTIYKDGHPMPDGFVSEWKPTAPDHYQRRDHTEGCTQESARLDLLLTALESLGGYEVSFMPSKPDGEAAADEYKEV